MGAALERKASAPSAMHLFFKAGPSMPLITTIVESGHDNLKRGIRLIVASASVESGRTRSSHITSGVSVAMCASAPSIVPAWIMDSNSPSMI